MKFTSVCAGVWAALAVGVCGGAAAQGNGGWDCLILDKTPQPIYEGGFGFVAQGDIEAAGDTSILEFDSGWNFAYFEDVLQGDVNLGLDFDFLVFSGSGGVNLPDQLVQLAIDAGGTWRYVRDWGLQVHVKPGIYSDIEEISGKGLSLPFSGVLVKSFSPEVSGRAGMEIRTDWELVVMPVVGVVWQPVPDTRVDVGLPETQISHVFSPAWTGIGGVAWNNESYAVEEEADLDPDQITVEDIRVYGRGVYTVTDELHVTGELGWVTGRSFEFEDPAEGQRGDFDVDDALYVRVGLIGPF